MSSKLKVLVASLVCMVTLTACPTDDEENSKLCGHWYDIVAQNTITPDRLSYHVGDTVTINSIIPRQAFDRNKGRDLVINDVLLDHSSFVIRTDLDMEVFDDADRNVQVLIDETDRIGDIIIDGAGSNVSNVFGKFQRLDSGDFAIRYRMVLTTAGDYWYRFGNHRDEPASKIVVENGCTTNTRRVYYEVQSVHDSNIDYLCDSPFYVCDNWIRDDGEVFHQNGGYMFRVLP